MTARQPPLFLPGRDLESCGDADERAFVDVHGPQRRSPWRVHNGPMGDLGRSAARPDVATGRRIHTVTVAGGWL